MKNYLVKSLFQVSDPNWSKEINRSAEPDIFPVYQQMHDLSLRSHEKYLEDPWELVFFGGQTTNIHQALKETFFKIYELWKSEPCNILYTDPDTVMIAPTKMFGQFDQFMMFNKTDPIVFIQPNRWNKQYRIFLNAGVRYFPASMSQQVWDIGLKIANDWDLSDWNTEQIILNEMAWAQSVPSYSMLRPEYAYQAFMIPQNANIADAWNHCYLEDAKIVHWHSSRNAAQRLEFMRQLAFQRDIKE